MFHAVRTTLDSLSFLIPSCYWLRWLNLALTGLVSGTTGWLAGPVRRLSMALHSLPRPLPRARVAHDSRSFRIQ